MLLAFIHRINALMPRISESRYLWLLILVLLLVMLSRFTRLDDWALNPDEIWSVWQTFGTPQQIIDWTPYDWPPGYYLALGGWRSMTAPHPSVLRLFSALAFLIGAVFVYRILARLASRWAGGLGVLAYASLGYSILLSIEVRGYALLLALLPLALWATMRYFDQPGWRRALPLALSMAGMFYVSLTSIGAFLALGLYTLVVYRRAIWRWWLPGLLAAVLALPEIINKSQIAVSRVKATSTVELRPPLEALANLFWTYTGLAWWLWVILLLVAGVALLWRRPAHRAAVALTIWVLLVPLLLYISNPVTSFFSARYSWWWMLGLALWVGWGLSLLPRVIGSVAAVALVMALYVPMPMSGEYNIFENRSPLGTNFTWLQQHMQVTDSLILDPSQECGSPEAWDYYTRVYFPAGLQFIDAPDEQRRIWLVSHDGRADAETVAALAVDYIPRRFVGPPGCLIRLYEAPPDRDGVLFENRMRFHGADVLVNDLPYGGPLVRHEGETVSLRLWWSVDAPVPLDYSVGLYLRRAGGGTVLDDTQGAPSPVYPVDGPAATSQWQPGTYYVTTWQLALPQPISRGQYAVDMAVYFWEDPTPIPAPGVNDEGLLRVMTFPVMAW